MHLSQPQITLLQMLNSGRVKTSMITFDKYYYDDAGKVVKVRKASLHALVKKGLVFYGVVTVKGQELLKTMV